MASKNLARISQINIVQATRKHTATVFFLHGSEKYNGHKQSWFADRFAKKKLLQRVNCLGSTGDDLKEWIYILNRGKLQFPHIKLIYPTAPSQPYTPSRGMIQNVWFDRTAISNEVSENVKSIDSMCQNISELIDKEVFNGIPLNRIILGGFSMGGCLALHVAYRYKPAVAGCFAMSSFLNKESVVYEHLKVYPEDNKVPLVQYHGMTDTLVHFEWGEETAKSLMDLGVNVKFVPLKGDHELTQEEILNWKFWLLDILPDK